MMGRSLLALISNFPAFYFLWAEGGITMGESKCRHIMKTKALSLWFFSSQALHRLSSQAQKFCESCLLLSASDRSLRVGCCVWVWGGFWEGYRCRSERDPLVVVSGWVNHFFDPLVNNPVWILATSLPPLLLPQGSVFNITVGCWLSAWQERVGWLPLENVTPTTLCICQILHSGDKCSMNFSFVGLYVMVDERLCKRAWCSLPSHLESRNRTTRVFSEDPKKISFMQNQASYSSSFNQLNRGARDDRLNK